MKKRCFVWATIPRQDLFYSVYNDDDYDDDGDDVDEKGSGDFYFLCKMWIHLIYVEKRMLLCGIISTKRPFGLTWVR